MAILSIDSIPWKTSCQSSRERLEDDGEARFLSQTAARCRSWRTWIVRVMECRTAKQRLYGDGLAQKGKVSSKKGRF